METTISFGYWVRRQRKALDLTQQQLALQVGCALVTIKKIEYDERQPSPELAELLANKLMIPSAERRLFIACALRERSLEHLALPVQPLAQAATAQPGIDPHLPIALTPLIGREHEVGNVCILLCQRDIRLVTLTGPGGVGKTRVALQVANDLINQFRDGVFFVSLAPIREADLVLATIAQTLGVRALGNRPLLDVLKAALRQRCMLLVLDNFEHVADAAIATSELLAACLALKVLITSRERLQLQGEYEYSIPPLPVPDPAVSVAQALFACPSVELFRQRAQAVRQDFTLNHTNAPAVAAICARLDGLPLAIELAAARAKLFAPQALLHRLTAANSHSPLHFLKADTRDAPERHHSLWETMAWSYALLNQAEQSLFRRLAVFAGGCILEAAEAVCGEGLSINILDGLASLVNKHLVRQVEHVAPKSLPEPRFMLLETVREFGLEQLQHSQELALTQQRHVTYYVNLVVDLGPELRTQHSVPTLATLQQEYPNICVALRWSLKQHHVEVCLQLCDALHSFWTLGRYKEAEVYLAETLALAEDSPPSAHYVNTLASAGYNAYCMGKPQRACFYLERGLAMNQAIGNVGSPMKVCMANGILAWIVFHRGDYSAAHAYHAAEMKNAQDKGDAWAMAMVLTNMGVMATKLGYFTRAASLLTDALAHHRAIGQKWAIALTLSHLGLLYIQQGEYGQAQRALAESQVLCEETEANGMLPYIKMNCGLLALEQADYPKATALLKAALIRRYELGQQEDVMDELGALAKLALQLNRPDCTLVLASAAAAQRRKLEIVLPPLAKQALDQAVLEARQQLGEEAAAAWIVGEAMTPEGAVAYALEKL